MKEYLTTVLVLACVALIVVLFVIKGGDNTQHETDASAIADISNRLDSAQAQLASRNGTILTLSNSLNQSQSDSLNLSNQLMVAESTAAIDTEQITNLTGQFEARVSENQALTRRVMELTNQTATLASQIASAQTNLNQVNKAYALAEHSLRRDVAERLVVERKFNNPFELQARMRYLKQHPAGVISVDSIYAELGVEVTSNAVRVISPE